MFAKNSYIHECLIRQMQNGVFKKEYRAILEGIIEEEHFSVNAPIARKDGSIINRCIDENGQMAVSHFAVLQTVGKNTLVSVILETGRTHQIRVHSASIGHPVLGDTLYGNNDPEINRQALHCYCMQFIHPVLKQKLKFVAKLPNDMSQIQRTSL